MLKNMINNLLEDWEKKAKETATPLDDIIVNVLKELVNLLI